MSVIHAPSRPEVDGRMLLFPVATVLLITLLFLRLWYFQVVRSEELTEKGLMYQRTVVSKLAPRGLIYDRKGVLLAGARPELVLTAVPSTVYQNEWVLEKAASMLNVDRGVLKEKVDAAAWKRHIPAPIFVGVPVDVATRVAESADTLPGLSVETQPMRYYPDTLSFTHLLGYAWVPDQQDVKRLTELGIKPAPYVGKAGVERTYERELMGTPGGDKMEVDSKRRPIRVIGRDNPVPGARLNLSIDARVQQAAIEALDGRRGGAVAIDPSTGEVIALVSSPSYDLTLFQGRISQKTYQSLQRNDMPLLNRAMYGSYQPGSTFKIVTTVAAMRAGVFSTTAPVFCPGFYALGNRRLRCLGRHGSISFRSAMARSCNTYFASLAHRTGEKHLRQTALDFGLGEKTGIDIPSEGSGVIPTDEWLLRRRKHAPVFYPGDTLNMGIGQGETMTTALQMANVVAMVANNGVSYRPHVVRAIWEANSDQAVFAKAEALHKIDLPLQNWRLLQDSLAAVVAEGTARRSGAIPGFAWAGKTGSAEHHGKNQKTHGWFVAFAPADKPKIALAVVVEAAGHGGEVAVPVAREMVKAYFGIGKSGVPAASNSAARESAQATASASPSAR